MVSPTFGTTGVDWENRLDIDRLRRERLARLKAELERSDLGALLTFDFHNIRYMTVDPHRHLGDGQDDPVRAAAARRRPGALGLRLGGHGTTSSTPRGCDEPHARRPDAAPHYGARAGISTLRGAISPGAGRGRGRRREGRRGPGRLRAAPASRSVSTSSSRRSCSRCRRWASPSSTGSRCSSRPAGSRPRTRSDCSPRPRRWSTPPTRISTSSCGPGVRENECVGLVSKKLYDLGLRARRGRQRDLRGALLTAPARVLRPADPPR